ncbi:MAG: glycosyltransferase family 4 protein [Legionellaceae bacterium]|nr:glycosyltransferase family 4 protein [Legionellaceae bacterium]
MKILILSFYYTPDLCAGSFRCTAFVEALKKQVSPDTQIDVMTTAPNRYASFDTKAPASEKKQGLNIERITLPTHKSGMLDQAKAFAHFSREVNKRIKHREYDVVFATSSRLMTAALGGWIARRKKAKLYLDIRDLFTDTIQDVLSRKLAVVLKPIFSFIEKKTVGRAEQVNLVSRGFEGYYKQHYPAANLSWFTNGIDSEFIVPNSLEPKNLGSAGSLTVLYAGNIGEGQGLHAIIPELAKRMEGRVRFKIIGDGGRKAHLIAALKHAQCHNVELLPPLSRAELIAEYQQADILFLHLNDYEAFRKVLPSKIFEYAAMGKPIWAGISGYSAEFVRSEVGNAAIFYPCNAMEAEAVFSSLKLEAIARLDFIEKYKRSHIMNAMASNMLSVL